MQGHVSQMSRDERPETDPIDFNLLAAMDSRGLGSQPFLPCTQNTQVSIHPMISQLVVGQSAVVQQDTGLLRRLGWHTCSQLSSTHSKTVVTKDMTAHAIQTLSGWHSRASVFLGGSESPRWCRATARIGGEPCQRLWRKQRTS